MALITMMFTDVVESSATKRDTSLGRDNRERDHAYLTQVQTPHFELVRACYNAHGGREVSTMGDAFFLAFDDPAEAVRCAVQIQQRLTETPIRTPRGALRLRIGIHSGFPEFFEGSWHGTDVDTTARVEAAATERQILVSARTYEITRDMTDAKFHACGEFALKGVGSIALWDVDWDGHGPRRPAALPVEEFRRRKRLKMIVGTTAALILVMGTGGYRYWATHHVVQPPDFKFSVRDRRTVAVMGFKNLGKPDVEWLANALSEMLSTELGSTDAVRTISPDEVSTAKADLGLAILPTFNIATLSRIHRILRSEYVISGAYVAMGNQPDDSIHIDVHVQDANSGETISSFGEDGTIGTLSATLRKAGAELFSRLGIPDPSAGGNTNVKTILPSDPEALRLYSEGVARLRVFDALGARDLLQKSIALEPNLALPHFGLARAWKLLGYDGQARDEAKKAVALSADLPRPDQKSIEAEYRELNSEWDEAIAGYQALWEFYPDEPNYALALANAQTSAGKGQEALGTLAKLGGQPQMKDDPRVDLYVALAAESLSDIHKQRDAAESAAEKATRQESRLLEAHAYWQLCLAYNDLDEFQKGEAACNASSSAAPFDDVIKARTQTVLASIMLAQGHSAEALEMRRQALETARKIGSQKDIIGALMNQANLLATEGQVAEAQESERKAIAIAREIGDKKQLLDLENNLASDFETDGDYQQAKRMYEDSLKTAQEIGDQDGISTAIQNLGSLSLQTGDVTLAEKEVRQALGISQDQHLQRTTAFALNNLGDIEMVKGNLAEARKNYESGLKLFTEAGDQPDIAVTRLSLAKLAIEDGKVTEAESLARQAIQEFRADKLTDNEADARNALARALISEGNVTAAQGEIDRVTKIAVQDFAIKISLAITAARLKARSGKIEEARRDLNSQLKEAKARNLVGLQFDTRLALAEITAPSDSKSKVALLAALDQDAKNSGYLLVAGKAELLRAPPLR
jgi:class 3 adenylate cyclase/tetratricopeptide (TPR) repeat protein